MIVLFRWSSVLLTLSILSGCASGHLAEPVGQSVPDPEGFASSLRAASAPATPQQVTFAWTLEEGGSRVRGRGVVRAEAPERIRLDLFGPRGETYLMAALVGGEYRLPAAASGAVDLPSQALLWAAMGVVHPPADGTLVTATASDGAAELRYQTPAGETFAYTLTGTDEGGFRLATLERASRQGVIETVSIERAPDLSLARARYRNWAEFRDLTLEIESIRASSAFPASTWRVDGTAP